MEAINDIRYSLAPRSSSARSTAITSWSQGVDIPFHNPCEVTGLQPECRSKGRMYNRAQLLIITRKDDIRFIPCETLQRNHNRRLCCLSTFINENMSKPPLLNTQARRNTCGKTGANNDSFLLDSVGVGGHDKHLVVVEQAELLKRFGEVSEAPRKGIKA
jgi:hypothetical protein